MLAHEPVPPDPVLISIRPDDAARVARIFFDAVWQGTGEDYTQAQKRAWAGDEPKPSFWREELKRQSGYLAVRLGRPIGFMTRLGDSHVALAYVSPRAAGQGVATRLFRAIETDARNVGATYLTTEASLTARPFFERMGLTVQAPQRVLRNGQCLQNFRMHKRL